MLWLALILLFAVLAGAAILLIRRTIAETRAALGQCNAAYRALEQALLGRQEVAERLAHKPDLEAHLRTGLTTAAFAARNAATQPLPLRARAEDILAERLELALAQLGAIGPSIDPELEAYNSSVEHFNELIAAQPAALYAHLAGIGERDPFRAYSETGEVRPVETAAAV